MKKVILFFVVTILLAGSVFALGITPGRTTFDFEPGAKKSVEFRVLNSEGQDIDLAVFVRGDLKDHINVSEEEFSLSADESERILSYVLDIPEDLEPGSHMGEIVVVQLPSGIDKSGDAVIGASAAVSIQVSLFVPYPGKYAEAGFNIIEGEEITFVIPIVSRGVWDLERVRGEIDIYTTLDEKVASIDTNEMSIPGLSRRELVANWNPDVPSGPYRAVATVFYDEETLTVEREFRVGTPVLVLRGIEVNDFGLGNIAKFEISVQSEWSEPIEAYARIFVYNELGREMAEFESIRYEIDTQEKKLMVAFWDTEGVSEGVYGSSVELEFAGKTVRKDFQLEVLEDRINVIGLGYVIHKDRPLGESSSLIFVLILSVIILIIINIMWFLVLRKKLK